jgi:hypothetical protein
MWVLSLVLLALLVMKKLLVRVRVPIQEWTLQMMKLVLKLALLMLVVMLLLV